MCKQLQRTRLLPRTHPRYLQPHAQDKQDHSVTPPDDFSVENHDMTDKAESLRRWRLHGSWLYRSPPGTAEACAERSNVGSEVRTAGILDAYTSRTPHVPVCSLLGVLSSSYQPYRSQVGRDRSERQWLCFFKIGLLHVCATG